MIVQDLSIYLMFHRAFGAVVCVDHHHYKELVARRFDSASCSFVELMMKFSSHISLYDASLFYFSDYEMYLLQLKQDLSVCWSDGVVAGACMIP